VYIIVKHLHAGITINDLEGFVNPVLKGGLFQKTASLKALKIVGLVNKEGKIIERHGLIRVIPESEKKRLIKALNARAIGLEKFVVDEYAIRHWGNDRRASNHFPEAHPKNRRASDRRRASLRMFTLSEKSDY
jgi:ribosomal protein L36